MEEEEEEEEEEDSSRRAFTGRLERCSRRDAAKISEAKRVAIEKRIDAPVRQR